MKTYYVNVDGIDVVVTQNSDGTFNIPNIFRGLGTALKPANEPIVLARKPLSEKTIAENVMKWGTGGLNIEGCRIPTEDNLNGGRYSDNKGEITCNVYSPAINKRSKSDYKQPTGRFPASVIHDEEAGRRWDE